MNPGSALHLPWLCPASEDFTVTIPESFESLISRCQYNLTLSQLMQVSMWLKNGEVQLPKEQRILKVLVLADDNLQNLGAVLEGTAPRYRLSVEVEICNFRTGDQQLQELARASSRQLLDLVIILMSEFSFPILSADTSTSGGAKPESLIIQETARAQRLVELSNKVATHVLFGTVPVERFSELGHLGSSQAHTRSARVTAFNQWIPENIPSDSVSLVDIASLSAVVGYETWFDERLYRVGRFQFSPRVYPLLADHILRVIAGKLGTNRRVLVLDLDDTIWGGVLGDDGVENLRVGPDDYISEAFLEFQRQILALKNRGVVLAICSKNYEDRVLQALDNHPNLLLRRRDFAMIVANWNDKSKNLKYISARLNLALSWFVFLDDNIYERERIRSSLPEVLVPELPDDPSLYSTCLRNLGCFETAEVTSEDSSRVLDLAAVEQREALRLEFETHDSFLEALETVVLVERFNSKDRNRVYQLTQKSNQFNLTTIRYSKEALERIESDETRIGLIFRLRDRLSDSGLIAVVVLHFPSAQICEIESWLMSCRVLNRGVEAAVIDVVAKIAKERHCTQIQGVYIPTTKNRLVSDVYTKFGFSISEICDNRERFLLRPEDHTKISNVITVLERY